MSEDAEDRATMGAVVQLPNSAERRWDGVVPTLRSVLVSEGYGHDAIEWILDDLKSRVVIIDEQASISVSAPLEFAEQVRQAISQHIDFHYRRITAFLFQMLELEKELYVAKFHAKKLDPPRLVATPRDNDDATHE